MEFTAKDVQTLRERTGCGMMDCKKALTEAQGDMDKAVELLREKGLAAVAKKAGRIASEGIVACTEVGGFTAVVEVNSETDFVANNPDFQSFVLAVAKTVAAQNPADVEDLKTKVIDGSSDTVAQALQEKVLTIGENISIRRFYRTENTAVTYIHGGGKIGVVCEFEAGADIVGKAEFVQMGKDVCMQIAAMSPQYLSRDVVPQAALDEEKNVLMAQIKNDPKNASKPDNIVEKMVIGKLSKFYENNCLLDQIYVKDNALTVGKYVESVAKALGGDIKVIAFTRFEKGEGLQKREDNFAAEIAGMVK